MELAAILIVGFIVAAFILIVVFSTKEKKVPNGWFIDGLIIYNELDHRGFASKGFILDPPDLKNTTAEVRNDFYIRFSRFLTTFNKPETIQLQWSIDSNYRDELLAFDRDTEQYGKRNPWTYFVRKQRFQRAWRLMEMNILRREHLKMFITVPIESDTPVSLSNEKLSRHFRSTIDSLNNYFNSKYNVMKNIFGIDSFKIRPMTDREHFRHYLEFLNPSVRKRVEFDEEPVFDPELTIQENCFLSEIASNRNRTHDNDYGFFMDGHYHQMLVIKRWPQSVYPGIFDRLTDTNIHDYSITVNMRCRNVYDEIKKEEKDIERLKGDYEAEKKHSLLTSIGKKEGKVEALASGFTYPYSTQIVIHAWSSTKEDLQRKMNAIKTSINLMGGAQYYECTQPMTSIRLFLETWPGWTFGNYDGYMMYAENTYLSMLLPLSSTFVGHLQGAEAIYDGNAFNLVGIKNYINNTPQHAAMFGMSGSGKSAMMCELLSQTECYYGFTVLIEEGLSYGMYTETMGQKPIIVKPDGRITMNYLDTQKLPITKSHLKGAVALVSKMCGTIQDEDRMNIRTAQIGQYVDNLYTDVFNHWKRGKEDVLPEIASNYVAVRKYLEEEMAGDDDFLDAWAEFRDLKKGIWPAHLNEKDGRLLIERAQEILAGVSEEEITHTIIEDPMTHNLRDTAFAWFDTEDYPTHSMLYEMMLNDPLEGHNREEVHRLATLLTQWSRIDGTNGCLFDGHTSGVDLTGQIAHFELGRLTSSDAMKTLAGFLINNYARQHVITLPRNIRKRYVFEEAGRLLDVPGGAEIVSESYAQMRKFNCWVISIVQQYGMFKDSKIRPVVMGNSRQWFIMKQNDRRDLEDINRDIGLPETTCETIMRYPSPETLPSHDRFSSLMYFHLDVLKPICGTLRNYVSDEMLFVASTAGADYDLRARTLAKGKNKVDAIQEFVKKNKVEAAEVLPTPVPTPPPSPQPTNGEVAA
jgi:L-rhamnose mutarotase